MLNVRSIDSEAMNSKSNKICYKLMVEEIDEVAAKPVSEF